MNRNAAVGLFTKPSRMVAKNSFINSPVKVGTSALAGGRNRVFLFSKGYIYGFSELLDISSILRGLLVVIIFISSAEQPSSSRRYRR